MNIFYLDENIDTCAQYHVDAHVVKMILESAQMLCTAAHLHGMPTPYKPTHVNHPCVIWTAASAENWDWLRALMTALNKEYQYRFEHKKPHQSMVALQALTKPPISSLGLTDRPQVMPESYKIPGHPVQAYRAYYASEKRHILSYTKRVTPAWMMGV